MWFHYGSIVLLLPFISATLFSALLSIFVVSLVLFSTFDVQKSGANFLKRFHLHTLGQQRDEHFLYIATEKRY